MPTSNKTAKKPPKPRFKGTDYSMYEQKSLNKKVTNSDLVLARLNPLIEAISSTVPQMVFSKPFYPTIYDSARKVDKEMSEQVTMMFDNLSSTDWAMIALADALCLGSGQDELCMAQNPETKFLDFNGMERRPTDTFVKPVDSSYISSSQRWKGIYYRNGQKRFDQTAYGGSNYGATVSLNPDLIFWLNPTNACFPDGPGILEYLIPFLDGAQFAFNLTYVVMGEQINPKNVKVSDPQPGDDDIVKKYLESSGSVDKVALPSNMEVEIPEYIDRQDILEFFKFYEKLMYRVIFPVAAISGEGGGLLDNSSNLAKEDLFYGFIDCYRQRICRSFNRLGNYWLDINGYKKKGYSFQYVASPISPRNIIAESKIMASSLQNAMISSEEYRTWLNSSVIGLRLEDNFDFENQLNLVKSAKVPAAAQNKDIQKAVENGDTSELLEKTADQVSKKNTHCWRTGKGQEICR